MFSFLAFVVAVIALIIAAQARNEVRRLRAAASGQLPVARVAPPVAEPARPEPPPPPPAPAPIPVPAPARSWNIDWENLVGIKLFSWIAGIALVLAAVFLFKYSVDHGWLRPPIRAGIGLISGIALLVICEMRVARNYRFTANAMDGAGIAILYATLFAMHARWQLWPAGVVFFGMLLVTAAAVFLSTRRDSVFIALLGLIGGFATPALLSSGENRPVALFSYLLLLNGGISWIAFRKRWPLLTALSVALTFFYQWAWVERFLNTGQLPLAASIFVLFAVIGASSLWPSREDRKQPVFRWIAAGAAVLPLLFAFFTAIVPEYGARYNVLFGFLLLMTAGLGAIAMLRGPQWLHALGGLATLVTFFIWLAASYTRASWPWSLVWLAGFVAFYLAAGFRIPTFADYTAGLLFFAFIGFAIREPNRYATLLGAMLALLVVVMAYAISRRKPMLAVIAIAFASIAAMTLQYDAPLWMSLAVHAALFVALLAIAWISERHVLAVLAVFFLVPILILAERFSESEQLFFGGVLCGLFLVYPLMLGARAKSSIAPHLAACLASVLFFLGAYDSLTDLGFEDVIGFLPVTLGALLLVLLWKHRRDLPEPKASAMLAGFALAFFTVAIPLQLDKEWITVSFALEAAALAWLFTRIPHRQLLVWVIGLIATVLVRLVFNPAVFEYHPKSATPVVNWYLYTYLVCAAAMFAAAYLLPRDERLLRKIAVSAGALELFVLLNIEIADFYSTGEALTFNFFSSSLAQDLTYTMGWALFAIATLIIGIAMHARGARIAALVLLLVTILKCFLHDLARLGGLYRVGSLFGLAVSLVLVGILLQRFVIMKSAAGTSPAPNGTT